MRQCDAELCAYWTGRGCICDVMDLRDAKPEGLSDETTPDAPVPLVAPASPARLDLKEGGR